MPHLRERENGKGGEKRSERGMERGEEEEVEGARNKKGGIIKK